MNSISPTTLLMDLGNVLVKIFPESMEKILLDEGAVINNDIKQRFYELVGKYECGKMESEHFIEQSCALIQFPYPEKRELFLSAWNAIIPPGQEIKFTMDVCRHLKSRNIPIVVFSNTNELHIKHVRKAYPGLLELFDHEVYSYEVGGAKPFPPMYEHAANVLGLIPGNTLYFDDMQENIDAGLANGFRAHLFNYESEDTFLPHLPEEWQQ